MAGWGLAILAAFLANGSCNGLRAPLGSDSTTMHPPMNPAGVAATKNAPTTDLHMSLSAEIVDGVLLMQYTVVNSSNRDVYLLNRVYDSSMQPKPDLIYIELLAGERTVHAYKDIPPIPEGFAPAMPHCPYVTPVRAHQRYAETVHIPAPVREFRAYFEQPSRLVEATYPLLSFSLGYYWSVPGMKEPTERLNSGVEVLLPEPPPRTKLEGGSLIERSRLSIPVLEPRT